MAKNLQVFISSTSIDLQEHRKAVFDVLMQAGEHAIDMNYFGSRPDDPQTVCRKAIEEADILVGIYAWRYGWVPEGDTRSITEMEFDHARALGKPCLCYLVDENYSWPPKFIEHSADTKLKAFKEKVNQLVRSTFTTPENLAMSVMADYTRQIKELASKEQPGQPAVRTVKKPIIQPQNRFLVNRAKQEEQFMIAWDNSSPASNLYFYLYGDAREAHCGLAQRFGYDLAGRKVETETPGKEDHNSGSDKKKWKYFPIKPYFGENEQLNRINLLKELYNTLGVDLEQPASQRALPDLLNSTFLKGFTKKDTVILLLTLDRHNWKPDHVPAVVRHFITNFCSAPLPDNAPRFWFFFGGEYDESNPELRQQIRDAIENRQYGEALDELVPVRRSDIEAWFDKPENKWLRNDDESETDITLRHFGHNEKYDMKSVINTLKQIIEAHNNGQL
jgi:hypothetical protein